jgi:hypothetical protein
MRTIGLIATGFGPRLICVQIFGPDVAGGDAARHGAYAGRE